MGLSGSGKSTIVRCLSRLVEPTAGTILLDGENLLAKSPEELTDVRRHKMGMVFQSFGLMPHLNVIDNVAFPLKLQGIKEANRYAQAERVIELVGLQGRETNFPNELSGGQQQRLVIARAIAIKPEVLLLDEPASALDPISTLKIEELINELKNSYTIVIVTHNMQQATRVSDFTAFMYLGDLIEFDETTKLFSTPAKKQTEDYITGRYG